MLVDTHCHLDFPQFNPDRDEVIQRAKENGVGYLINAAANLKSSRESCALAQKYPRIYACVGVHPHEADTFSPEAEREIKLLAKPPKVVAVGEAGLDYYRNLSPAEAQKKTFRSLINLAKELNLPLIVHTRSAQEDTLRILKEELPLKAVVHCFSGDADFLKECMDLGFFISFTCNITYEKAQGLRDIAKVAPLDRIMLETDAPYLPPQELRGKRNEPANVKILAGELSRIKGVDFSVLAEITTDNAVKFFNLK